MKRIAQTIRLRPEHREEYLRLHSAVWPGVEAALHRANIRNYSIFLHGDVLFAYVTSPPRNEGASRYAGLASRRTSPARRTLMAPTEIAARLTGTQRKNVPLRYFNQRIALGLREGLIQFVTAATALSPAP